MTSTPRLPLDSIYRRSALLIRSILRSRTVFRLRGRGKFLAVYRARSFGSSLTDGSVLYPSNLFMMKLCHALVIVALAAATTDQFHNAHIVMDDTNVTVCKVDFPTKGDCGQTQMPSADAKFPVRFGGFKMGPCSAQGYSVADGAKQECSPKVAGKQWCANFDLFKKASINSF
jgi:hypothetical protein